MQNMKQRKKKGGNETLKHIFECTSYANKLSSVDIDLTCCWIYENDPGRITKVVKTIEEIIKFQEQLLDDVAK